MAVKCLLFALCAFVFLCLRTHLPPSAFHCVCLHAFMHVSVFIDIANGFSAGPKFVCSVTQYGSWFIRQAFRIEA